MNKYINWDDEIKPEDIEFLKIYPSGEVNYFVNGKLEKEDYQNSKIKALKSKKKNIGQAVEAMLAFNIMDEDTLKKPEENNRRRIISNLSDKLLIELVDVLSFSLELSDYEHCNTKYTTQERKDKYKNVYMEVKKYEDYLDKLTAIKIIREKIDNLKSDIKDINYKQNFVDSMGEADNFDAYQKDEDIYLQLLSIGIANSSIKIEEIKRIIDEAEKEKEIFLFESLMLEKKTFDGYQALKVKKMKEMASFEKKVNKIVEEVKSSKFDIYNSKFPFQNLNKHSSLAEKVTSNLIINKEKSDSNKYFSNTKNFLNLLIDELLKRDLISQASKSFTSPYVLLDENFSKQIDYMNSLTAFFENIKVKKIKMTGNDIVRSLEYDIDDLKESLKDLNILWEALDSEQKINYSNAVLEVAQGNINYSIENDFVICDGKLEDLLLETLKNHLSYNNETMLSAAKKIMLYREDVIDFNIKKNVQKNKMEIDFETYFKLLNLLENKYPGFKEKNKELYLPSTQLILSDDVVFDTKTSLEVSIDIKSLIGLQNKQFNDYPFLTRDKFLNYFNKFWKQAVLENEIMEDFISKEYSITEKDKVIIFVKSIPSLNMNNEQLNNWANKFLSKLLIESDWRNLKETVNLPYKIEELSQKELLEINGVRAKSKTAVRKF